MTVPRRTALVTGSGRNIGRGIALSLAARGFNVVINGSGNVDACEEVAARVREAGAEALVIMGDVGVRQDAERLAREALDRFGVVDVLINNAAIRPNAPFLEVDEDAWNRVMDVDFNGPRWLSQACLPGMCERGFGRIVNFSGMNAQAGYPGKPHVTAAKHALWGLTKSLAKEFGPAGVTANIIAPGTIVGESADTHSMAGRLDALRDANPTRRLGTPGDIAAMVELLVSDEGGFINGQLLQVNGGVTG